MMHAGLGPYVDVYEIWLVAWGSGPKTGGVVCTLFHEAIDPESSRS